MAKKKSASSISLATAAPNGKSSKPKTAAPRSHLRPFSDEQIGLVAGEIWQLLSANGSQSLSAVKKAIDAPTDLISAAVGWLAREGKLDFSKRGRSVNLTLR